MPLRQAEGASVRIARAGGASFRQRRRGGRVGRGIPAIPALPAPLQGPLVRSAAWAGLAAVAIVVAAVGLPPLAVPLLFLGLALLVAAVHGRWPGLLAVVSGAIAWIVIQWLAGSPAGIGWIWPTVPVYLLIGIGGALLIGHIRERERIAETAAAHASALYLFSRRLSDAGQPEEVEEMLCRHVADALSVEAVVLAPAAPSGSLVCRQVVPAGLTLDAAAGDAAAQAYAERLPVGCGTARLPGLPWLFVPLAAGERVVGVLGVRSPVQSSQLMDQIELLQELGEQATEAMDRTRSALDTQTARVLSETERLRSALLSSISHDLRTPLASILGSVTALRNYGADFPESSKDELLGTIQEEAERLNRFVGNLLDMTRLGSGALQPKREWSDIDDIIGNTLSRMASRLSSHEVALTIQPGLPLLNLDYVLIEQVLANLLDNAAKYSPAGSLITIEVQRDEQELVIAVSDEGGGIPEEEREQVFDMFYRVKARDRQVAGTGLGLAICRGIIEAHGGTVQIRGTAAGIGTRLEVRLPIEAQPPHHPELAEEAEPPYGG